MAVNSRAIYMVYTRMRRRVVNVKTTFREGDRPPLGSNLFWPVCSKSWPELAVCNLGSRFYEDDRADEFKNHKRYKVSHDSF